MKSPAGTWYCHTVEQFQSDALRAIAVHSEDGLWPPSPAHETEFRGATLELAAGGRYVLRNPDLELSSGTWDVSGAALSLAEDPEGPRYFEKLRGVRAGEKSIRLEFGLIPDAHDGLDVLALEFRGKPQKLPKPSSALTPASVVELVKAGKWTGRQQNKLDDLPEAERAAIFRGAWDAYVAGTFAANPSADECRDQVDFLVQGARLDVPAVTHRHVVHAMRTLEGWGRNLMAGALASAIARLPPSADDALVAAAMVFSWNFEDAARLFEGRPELPAVLAGHYGNGALARSRALITARGDAPAARAAAVASLAALEPAGARIVGNPPANTRRLVALAFGVLFRESATELPAAVATSLAYGGGTHYWALSDEDKALLRASAETLDADARAQVAATFYL